jgi:hypothetical protein
VLNTVKTRLLLRGGDKRAVSSNPTPIKDVMRDELDHDAPRENEMKQSAAAAPKTVDFCKRTFPLKLSLSRCVEDGDPMAMDRGVQTSRNYYAPVVQQKATFVPAARPRELGLGIVGSREG